MDAEWEERRKKLQDRITATQDELERRKRERDAKVASLQQEKAAAEQKKASLLAERKVVQRQLEEQGAGVEQRLAELDRERERLLEEGRGRSPGRSVSPRRAAPEEVHEGEAEFF